MASDSPKQVCPGCGQEMESGATAAGSNCPRCGGPPPALPAAPRIPWGLVILALLFPALLSLLGAATALGGLAVGGALLGSLASGLLNGFLLGRGLGKTTGFRIVLGVMFAFVFGGLSLTLAFFGCMAGGFKMDMR